MEKILLVAIALSSTAAAAQNDATVLPRHDHNLWNLIMTKDGANLVHKASGAVCPGNFRDLKLTGMKDYVKDGTNSSCQFEKNTKDGLTRMTLYFYTHPSLSSPAAFKSAKNAIFEKSKITAVKITEKREEGQKCFQSFVPNLATSILERNKKDNPGQKTDLLQLGVAMFNYDIPKTASGPAHSETSLLSVYQTGKWIVKARVNLPAGETSGVDACRYAAFANIGEASMISRK
ncbi:MAG: hypothetical protein V3V15_03940 [Sphingorhabdus sp.]